MLMVQAAGASSPYVLRQVPGKGGQINPLTTLVAAGVVKGFADIIHISGGNGGTGASPLSSISPATI